MNQDVPPVKKREMTEEEIRASAKRNIALGILPAMVSAHTDMKPHILVRRTYAIAEQMLKQGDKA